MSKNQSKQPKQSKPPKVKIESIYIKSLPEDHEMSLKMVAKLCELKVQTEWELLEAKTQNYKFTDWRLGQDKEFFSGQIEPKSMAKNGFGKIIDRQQNYFFGVFKDDLPQYGYLFIENPLRLVKVDVRAHCMGMKNQKKGENKNNLNNLSTSETTEDNTPTKNTNQNSIKNSKPTDSPIDLGDLEKYFSTRVKHGIIHNFQQCTEYHGEIKHLRAHGEGFVRVQNDYKALKNEDSLARMLKVCMDFKDVVFTSKCFEKGAICGKSLLTFTTIFSFLDHPNILRSAPGSAVKKLESSFKRSEDDDMTQEEIDEDESSSEGPFFSKNEKMQEMEELTLVREDSSINKMKHSVSVEFVSGKFSKITGIDATNVAPQFQKMIALPGTFPVQEFLSSESRFKFQKVKLFHGRTYVEDVIFYTFSGDFGVSAILGCEDSTENNFASRVSGQNSGKTSKKSLEKEQKYNEVEEMNQIRQIRKFSIFRNLQLEPLTENQKMLSEMYSKTVDSGKNSKKKKSSVKNVKNANLLRINILSEKLLWVDNQKPNTMQNSIAVDYLMKPGVKSIAKILHTGSFEHQSSLILMENLGLNQNAVPQIVRFPDLVHLDEHLFKSSLNFDNFQETDQKSPEKYSLYVLSVHYQPTIAVKYSIQTAQKNSESKVYLFLQNEEISAKIHLTGKNKDTQYPAQIYYKQNRLAQFEGLIALEGEYLEEKTYPNLNLEPVQGVYSEPKTRTRISFTFLESDEVKFNRIEADLPSKYHFEGAFDEESNCFQAQILDKNSTEIYKGAIDTGILQKSTKYAITWPAGKSVNPFINIRLIFVEKMFKKSKKGSLYYFKGHSQTFDLQGNIEKGVFKKGKYMGSLVTGQVIDMENSQLWEYVDASLENPTNSKKNSKNQKSWLTSVTINKQFFKGKYYDISDHLYPQSINYSKQNHPSFRKNSKGSKGSKNCNLPKSIILLTNPICRFGCYTLGIPKVCAFKNELGSHPDESISQCTSIKMLMPLNQVQKLLHLPEKEDTKLNLRATFCDVYANRFTVCVSQKNQVFPRLLADSEGNISVGAACEETHCLQAPFVTASVEFFNLWQNNVRKLRKVMGQFLGDGLIQEGEYNGLVQNLSESVMYSSFWRTSKASLNSGNEGEEEVGNKENSDQTKQSSSKAKNMSEKGNSNITNKSNHESLPKADKNTKNSKIKPYFHILYHICFTSTKSLVLYSNYTVYLGSIRTCQSGKLQRHGRGKLIYENGDFFEGEFRRNQFDGLGKMVYRNGDVLEAQFSAGKFKYDHLTSCIGSNGVSITLSSGENIN